MNEMQSMEATKGERTSSAAVRIDRPVICKGILCANGTVRPGNIPLTARSECLEAPGRRAAGRGVPDWLYHGFARARCGRWHGGAAGARSAHPGVRASGVAEPGGKGTGDP